MKSPAKNAGIFEITQSGDSLLLKFHEEFIDANLIMGLDRTYPKRIKLLSDEKPIVSYALKGDYKNILNTVSNLIYVIKELQNAEK